MKPLAGPGVAPLVAAWGEAGSGGGSRGAGVIKLSKIKHKEQILKAAREKQQITHKGIPIRITADLSIETLQARREWQDTFPCELGPRGPPHLWGNCP